MLAGCSIFLLFLLTNFFPNNVKGRMIIFQSCHKSSNKLMYEPLVSFSNIYINIYLCEQMYDVSVHVNKIFNNSRLVSDVILFFIFGSFIWEFLVI